MTQTRYNPRSERRLSVDTKLNDGVLVWSSKPSREYVDWSNLPGKEWQYVGVDQAKFNLSWLVYPELDNGSILCLPELYVAALINMSRTTRDALAGWPLDFLKYWDTIDSGNHDLLISESMPSGYREVMGRRAVETQIRLGGPVQGGNVVQVDFGRKRGG